MQKNTTETTILAEGDYFRFVREGTWEYIQPKKFHGVVMIVPIKADGKMILIEQYRTPVKNRVIEIPAGLIGDEADRRHEAPADAARRELLEETGYLADQLELLTEGAPSAGSNSVILTFFLATELRKISAGGGDETENITVHEVPVNDVLPWLEARQAEGKIIDLKVYAGLLYAQRKWKQNA